MSDESTFFNDAVPNKLQASMLRAVFDGCIAAHEAAKKVDADWFENAVSVNRRLHVEPLLSKLVLPRGFTATPTRTTSACYTVIESPRVVITALTRNFRRTWVRPDPYRETLAREAQLVFDIMREKVPAGARLYALLVYGGDLKKRLPTLADIAFPTPTGQFAPGTIDLLGAFPDIVGSYLPKPAIEPEIHLRKKKKTKDGDDPEGA